MLDERSVKTVVQPRRWTTAPGGRPAHRLLALFLAHSQTNGGGRIANNNNSTVGVIFLRSRWSKETQITEMKYENVFSNNLFLKKKSLKANKRKGRCLSGRFKREGPSSRGDAAGFFRLCVNHGSPEVCRAGGSIGMRAVGGNQHRLFKASEGRGQGRAPASAPGGCLQGALGIQRQEVVVVLGRGGGTHPGLWGLVSSNR